MRAPCVEPGIERMRIRQIVDTGEECSSIELKGQFVVPLFNCLLERVSVDLHVAAHTDAVTTSEQPFITEGFAQLGNGLAQRMTGILFGAVRPKDADSSFATDITFDSEKD